MGDNYLQRLNTLILHKSDAISSIRHDINDTNDFINAKKTYLKIRSKSKNINDTGNYNFLKKYVDSSKKQNIKNKKDLSRYIKELRMIEDVYKKRRKDPNYKVDFALLEKLI